MACATCHKVRAAVFSMLACGKDTVEMVSDYTHKVGNVHIRYAAGATYHLVPAAVAASIVAARAGTVLDADA